MHSLLLYDNVNCKDPSHINTIDHLYTNITEALCMSSQEFVNNMVIRKDGQIAGWMKYCSASHAEARDVFYHWAT